MVVAVSGRLWIKKMADAGVTEPATLKVYISCARKDEDFAQELRGGLELAGFNACPDNHDIAAEDWRDRLGPLIEAADAVVYVISPDAVASERCAWELERTVILKKRLLPIVWRRVEEGEVPPQLRQLNSIFFDRPLTFIPSLKALNSVLETDSAWVQEHTRIGEAALKWEGRGRAEALLLRGEELAAAKSWLASRPKNTPDPTPLHHEFVKAAEDAEAARGLAERQSAAALEPEKAKQGEQGEQGEQEKREEKGSALRRGYVLAAAAGVFACIIVAVIGWYNQAQYQWRIVMRPAVLTAEQEKQKAAMPGSDFRECARGCPTMIVVPAGKFIMGSPETEKDRKDNEGPRHEVTITKPFAVGRTDITFAEWDMCVAARACPKVPDNGWGRSDRPVIGVSWEEATAYVTWLKRSTGKDYRLLSEAEWEYAARSGNQGPWWFGDDDSRLADYAWFDQNSENKTQPVAKKAGNAFGLYDMHGDVWQWVEDPYHDNYDGAPSDGSVWRHGGDAARRVLRGGAWNGKPGYLRSASRSWLSTGGRFTDSGFRVARALAP
jgi:formylglycine-generating enzyme required for sulfatase activity